MTTIDGERPGPRRAARGRARPHAQPARPAERLDRRARGALLTSCSTPPRTTPRCAPSSSPAPGRGFCAGADMDDLEHAAGDGDAERPLRDVRGRATFPLTVRKPLIAAINGAAAGLGLVEALYCDVRFATPRGEAHDRLRAPRPDRRVRHRLAAAAAGRAPARALDLLLSGRVVRGEEALRLGLVDRLSRARARSSTTPSPTPPDLAENCSPASMATIKAQVQRGPRPQLRRGRRGRRRADARVLPAAPTSQEGVRSYLEQAPAGVPVPRPPEAGS